MWFAEKAGEMGVRGNKSQFKTAVPREKTIEGGPEAGR
jgi:hypothetical protein